MSKFPIDQHQIFQATNGGLDIIQRFLDIKDVNKHFKIRKEGTESANISKQDGVWFVKDWGDASGFFKDSKHAIHIYAHYTDRTYFEALLELGKELGLIDKKQVAVKNISKCSYTEFHKGEHALNDEGFHFVTKDFTDYELEVLGPLVTQEVCQKYGMFSLESYSWLKSEELTQKELCNVFTVKSSETYPIFAFIVTEGGGKPKLTLQGTDKTPKVEAPAKERTWLKIYQPKSSDKKYRFSYLGKKPKQHIFGLENLKKVGAPKIEESIDPDTKETVQIERPNKVHRVVICSGDRDSLNMASTSETVIWFNSETAQITETQINLLLKYAHTVVNVPDLDPTGFDAGKKLALEHLEIKTAWLPESLTKRKDFRGNPMKDFTDFMKSNAKFDDKEQKELKKKAERFLELARPGKFWTESYSKQSNKTTYNINYKNAFNFLKLNGFSRIKDETRKDGYYFVHQDKHILREVSPQEIKDFFNFFLDEKQQEKGLRAFPDELLNMLIGSEAVSDKKLVNLPTRDFDFTDYTPTSQFFFFDKFIWEVNKDEVIEINKGYSRYVMEKDILNNIIKRQTQHDLDSSKIKIEAYYRIDNKIEVGKPFFTIKKDDSGNFDLTIHRKDCDFQNYLINTSRVFWKDEIKDLPKGQREDYLQENKFIIDNYKTEGKHTGLDDDQIYEQELHFINKVYAYGYMLHRYKDPTKAWVFYLMDNEVVDDNMSQGRTGKSLLADKAIRLWMNSKYMNGRKKGLLDNDFLYDGVTPQTDYILYDDADKRLPFQQLFTDVTGDMNVNPKNGTPYTIARYESPKIAISTNYAPVGLDTSTTERILFSAFADWYHGESEEYKKREPKDDFGHQFFSEWDAQQWNLFINFSIQCLQFYLGQKHKIGAPMGNIKKRNLTSEMGPVFLEWAEDYFRDKMNQFVVKKEALKTLHEYNKAMQSISSSLFKKRVVQFCELKGHTFNPDIEGEKKDKEGRFMKWYNPIGATSGSSEEHFYLKSNVESEDEETTEKKGIYD